MAEKRLGTLITLVAGIAWGLSGVSGQYLMSRGVSVDMITSLRLVVSGVFLTGLAYLTAREQLIKVIKSKQALLGIFVFAMLGLVLNQMAYLQAIYYTNAGTATVLQYLCPILVLAYTCLKNRQKPRGIEMVSIVLAIAGTLLIATHGQLTELAITPLGLAWGLFSALTYALYIILPAQVINQYGSLSVIGLGMLMGGLMVTFGLQTWQEPFQLDSGSMFGLVGIVGVGTIFAYTAFLKGVSMVGPVNGSLLASIEPIASVFFAVWLVNERFYPIDFLGMALILGAVLLISEKSIG
ncbi:TPA: EamA family transporter [Streptococcus suis]|uniref:DMT family transporter n=1 Tax=Streptococcus suis TaxID=1307 RepID=UPI001C987424|nr:DMT family transporter [Streptococcus suis]MBY4982227.1 DMT family transporter [Streptococcus suis]MBY4992971.1 DMT family transporter [Streptococcus suis]MBY5008354.1 DMT family transporter [Streptococcus suis]HEM5209115.1 EamA family transporter [Streptococcus suis]HEM5235255.1 EamA family transporter [Streptococcus suis]